MLPGDDDPLKALFAGYETTPADDTPPFVSDFQSEWLFDEIDNVYVRSLWPDRQLHGQPHFELCGIIERAICMNIDELVEECADLREVCRRDLDADITPDLPPATEDESAEIEKEEVEASV